MGIFDFIVEGLRSLGNWLINIINRLISFVQDVLGWFKMKNLDPRRDTPFVMQCDPEMRKMLGKAPRRNIGLFKGVYDEQTDTIEGDEIETTEGFDRQTQEVLGGEKLVVLQ